MARRDPKKRKPSCHEKSSYCQYCIGPFFVVETNTAQARGVIVYNWGGISVEQIDDLPDTEQFKSQHGYMNLGFAQNEYSIFWMPLWKTEGHGYVLYVEKDDNIYYRKLNSDQLQALGKVTGKTYAADYSPSFLAGIWGWAPVLLLIGFIGFSGARNKE